MHRNELDKIKEAIRFTEIYNTNSVDKCLREAMCVDYQLENILLPLKEEDLIAGRMEHGYIGFSSQYGGIYTYYYNEHPYLNALEACKEQLEEETLQKAEFAAEFWKLENTAKKHSDAFISRYGFEPPHSYKNYGFYNCDSRVAGTNLDFHILMECGLDGMDQRIEEGICQNGKSSFYSALKMWVNSLRKVCDRYRMQALSLSQTAKTEEKRCYFTQLAEALLNIEHSRPKTLLEGIQLLWIYSVSCDLMNYGRMDDYLAPLYEADRQAGRMNDEEAVILILDLYKHFREIGKVHDCRIIIGGLGRKHPEEADALAMCIMEASRRFKETVPQLTLRYYKGMDEKVFRKAMEVNAEGCTFPIIYSDETNIPAVEKLYGVTRKEAEQYVPFGCGEYVMIGLSLGTPNNGINMLKALEVTLHNGEDSFYHVVCGKKTGEPTRFATFEQLWEALRSQLEEPVKQLAVHKFLNYRVAGDVAGYLHQSLLMHDCIETGKPLLDGGVRYLNAASEVFGIISCADSLTAIKKYVYDEKRVTLGELVEILDSNYEGHQEMRMLLQSAPKYGNDNEEADTMAVKVFDMIADMTAKAGREAGLHRYAIVSVNNSMSAEWGGSCLASACGRKQGDAMSNGNAPSIGGDKKGITALLNSMAKFDNSRHAGVINNIRFSREMFEENMDKVTMLLQTFYENGGVQNNITVVGREDLQKAMIEPENYQNLLVRIGGFSARFVTLSPVVQREIIARTTYH